MKFPDLLTSAIQRSEIPLRFEPGAEESVAKPVAELLRVWIEAHQAEADDSQRALLARLQGELDGVLDVPE
jgi:hypothetical protein